MKDVFRSGKFVSEIRTHGLKKKVLKKKWNYPWYSVKRNLSMTAVQ